MIEMIEMKCERGFSISSSCGSRFKLDQYEGIFVIPKRTDFFSCGSIVENVCGAFRELITTCVVGVC